MKMKSFVFLALLVSLPSLLAFWVDDEEKIIRRVIIEPNGKSLKSNGKLEHRRLIRSTNTCRLPTTMDDAQLDCKIYPTRVHCTQTCMFGYTLSQGIQREMKCRFDENKWEPVPDFEKCEPFVDCTVTIGPGGKYLCYTNYLEKGNVCEISCEHYEDKAAVPNSKYQCDINGKWSPKLPFCAKAGTDLKLVPPPSGAILISPN